MSNTLYKKQKSRDALGQIRRHVKKLDSEDLHTLYSAVHKKIQKEQNKLRQKSMRRFSLGDTVSFIHEGEKISGIIIRINQKTVSMTTSAGEWRVSPSSLIKE